MLKWQTRVDAMPSWQGQTCIHSRLSILRTQSFKILRWTFGKARSRLWQKRYHSNARKTKRPPTMVEGLFKLLGKRFINRVLDLIVWHCAPFKYPAIYERVRRTAAASIPRLGCMLLHTGLVLA